MTNTEAERPWWDGMWFVDGGGDGLEEIRAEFTEKEAESLMKSIGKNSEKVAVEGTKGKYNVRLLWKKEEVSE